MQIAILLISAGPGGRCCRLVLNDGNRSEGLVLELSLEFCATGCVHEQLAIMPRVESIRCIEESMKASRFAHLCSAAVRQSLVGAFVVDSLLSASQPVRRMVMRKGMVRCPSPVVLPGHR